MLTKAEREILQELLDCQELIYDSEYTAPSGSCSENCRSENLSSFAGFYFQAVRMP